MLLQLALAQVIDLGLNREPFQLKAGFRVYTEDNASPAPRTLEERRAFLGLCYLFSVFVITTPPFLRVTLI